MNKRIEKKKKKKKKRIEKVLQVCRDVEIFKR